MDQHRITTPGPLLDENGALREPGWATSMLLDYNRAAIRASRLRIKEWDYYLVCGPEYAVALTIADNGYMGLDSVSLLDFRKPWEQTTSRMRLLPMGRTGLPASSASGDVSSCGKGYSIAFSHGEGARVLEFSMERFRGEDAISGRIRLTDEPTDSMVIATPFAGKPKAFYYNQKINCMRAQGSVSFAGETYAFTPDTALGTLDWGRGVWTYDNTWYWGSCSAMVDGRPFGFNIGYGFGDTSAATENMIFWEGRAHKLAHVDFGIPQRDGQDDFMAPWNMTSSDGRFTLRFDPVIDRASHTSVGVIYSNQHQVFGHFSGTVVLDGGETLALDRVLGFAEKVANKW